MLNEKKPGNIRCCDCKWFSLDDIPVCESARPWWAEKHEWWQFHSPCDALIRHSCDLYEKGESHE